MGVVSRCTGVGGGEWYLLAIRGQFGQVEEEVGHGNIHAVHVSTVYLVTFKGRTYLLLHTQHTNIDNGAHSDNLHTDPPE